MRIGIVGLAAILTAGCALEAQDTDAPGPLVFNGSIRDRIENWHWFTPASGTNKYTFDGNTVRLGISQNRKAFDWMFEIEVPILLNLPSSAVAPGAQGQLGLGASYYLGNNKSTDAAMLFAKQLFVRFHDVFGVGGSALQLGRFEFFDGAEVKSPDATVASVKKDRIQQRLIGNFGYTDVQRAFDGFHYSYDKPSLNYTLVGAVPTRGVFQVDGWGWNDVAFSYGAMTRELKTKSTASEFRLFAIYYDDFRPVTKTDNRPAAVRAADHSNIRLRMLGGHYVNALTTSAGVFDLMGEGAVQFGDRGDQQQRAGMFALEPG